MCQRKCGRAQSDMHLLKRFFVLQYDRGVGTGVLDGQLALVLKRVETFANQFNDTLVAEAAGGSDEDILWVVNAIVVGKNQIAFELLNRVASSEDGLASP